MEGPALTLGLSVNMKNKIKKGHLLSPKLCKGMTSSSLHLHGKVDCRESPGRQVLFFSSLLFGLIGNLI